MTEWFYQRGEAQFGPLSTDQLKAVWQRGHRADDTLVRRHGAESWEPISHADVLEIGKDAGRNLGRIIEQIAMRLT